MRNIFRWIGSYLWGIKLGEYPSAVSGTLELWYINGRKLVNGPHVNYSFDSLHRVFQTVFRRIGIRKNPPKKVLILGFGAGSVAHILQHEYALNCHITGVELDPVMLQLAGNEFGQKPSARLCLIPGDAVAFAAADTGTYDLIVVDVFVDDRVPDAIVSTAFLQHVLKRLAPQGRLCLNLMTHTETGKQQVRQLQQMALTGKVQFLHPRAGNVVFYCEKS